MQGAHRRHEPDDALGAPRGAQRRAHVGDRPHRPHAAATARVASASHVVEAEQLGRALADRLAMARHGGLVAADDRPGQRGVALDGPGLDRGAHQRHEHRALDARRGRQRAPPPTRASPGSSRPSRRRRGRRPGPRRRSRTAACPGRGRGARASVEGARRRAGDRAAGAGERAAGAGDGHQRVQPEGLVRARARRAPSRPSSGPPAGRARSRPRPRAIWASGTQSRHGVGACAGRSRARAEPGPAARRQGAAKAAVAHDGDRFLHLMSDPAPESGCRSLVM